MRGSADSTGQRSTTFLALDQVPSTTINVRGGVGSASTSTADSDGNSTAVPGCAATASSRALPSAFSATCSSEFGSDRCAMRQVLTATRVSRGC
jgi:hypothetical protein